MPLIKNFRNEFGGGWASVYTATAKRRFVYKHRSDIKKGVTVTVEYKGETHTKTFSKEVVRACMPPPTAPNAAPYAFARKKT